jgi:hypothetical protein
MISHLSNRWSQPLFGVARRCRFSLLYSQLERASLPERWLSSVSLDASRVTSSDFLRANRLRGSAVRVEPHSSAPLAEDAKDASARYPRDHATR